METLPAVIEVEAVEVDPGAESEIARRSGSALPAVQAAAVVAGGFVAGAATVVLARRVAAHRPTRRARRRRDLRRVEVVSSRSFLVDVHVIDRR